VRSVRQGRAKRDTVNKYRGNYKIKSFIIYENDQQDATAYDNLLFLGCSTCSERYFRSSSVASKLYYRFWYYTRISLPAGIVGVLELCSNAPTIFFLGRSTCSERYFRRQRHTCVIPEAVIQFRCSWWWAKISLETCRVAKELINYPTQLHLVGHFRILYHDAGNMSSKFRELYSLSLHVMLSWLLSQLRSVGWNRRQFMWY
jgi:hypothetical protein